MNTSSAGFLGVTGQNAVRGGFGGKFVLHCPANLRYAWGLCSLFFFREQAQDSLKS